MVTSITAGEKIIVSDPQPGIPGLYFVSVNIQFAADDTKAHPSISMNIPFKQNDSQSVTKIRENALVKAKNLLAEALAAM